VAQSTISPPFQQVRPLLDVRKQLRVQLGSLGTVRSAFSGRAQAAPTSPSVDDGRGSGARR